MNGLSALAVGVLFTSATYLLLSRNMQRVAIGFILLANAANLLVLTASGLPSGAIAALIGEPTEPDRFADPLPQAFVLTAIVIGLGSTAFLLALMARIHREKGTDRVEVPPWK